MSGVKITIYKSAGSRWHGLSPGLETFFTKSKIGKQSSAVCFRRILSIISAFYSDNAFARAFEKPVAGNDTDEGRAKNCRGEIVKR
jgi:hypothetical protein